MVIINTTTEALTLKQYTQDLMALAEIIDTIEPDEVFCWSEIYGDCEFDGYPGHREGTLIETILRHLFCKKTFKQSTGLSIYSFIQQMGSLKTFIPCASVLIQLLGPQCAPLLNGVGLKIVDSVLMSDDPRVPGYMCEYIRHDLQNDISYKTGEPQNISTPFKSDATDYTPQNTIFNCGCPYVPYFDTIYKISPAKVRIMHA